MNHYDHLNKRCPMLGHDITFKYCRGDNLPSVCRKIRDCWFETIPVDDYLQEHFSPEDIANITTPPRPKMMTLVELIRQAQATIKDKEDRN